MPADDVLLRGGTSADRPAVHRLFTQAFHTRHDPEITELDDRLYDPARSVVAVRGDTVVGHTGSYRRALSLPGGEVDAAHVALVAVEPGHRRRGVLTRLMGQQLADLRAAGEPLAVLWASEGRIYPRFGFGLATTRWVLTIDTREIGPPSIAMSAGRVEVADPVEAASRIRVVYDRIRTSRPGWSGRDNVWWRHRTLADPTGRRRGATPWRAALHHPTDDTHAVASSGATASDGTTAIDGYALWRVLPHWDTAGPAGQVEVRELVAGSSQAYAALWRFLLTLDLTRSVRYALAAPDEPLVHLVDEPRRLAAQLADGLWLRIIDLPAAVTARRYTAPIDVVLEVSDRLLPDNGGRWRLTGDSSGARCEPTTAAADLGCDIADLSAALLGDGALMPLAGAGRVTELRRGSLAATHLAFGWPLRPSAVEMF